MRPQVFTHHRVDGHKTEHTSFPHLALNMAVALRRRRRYGFSQINHNAMRQTCTAPGAISDSIELK